MAISSNYKFSHWLPQKKRKKKKKKEEEKADIAQTPSAYNLGPYVDDWLLANLNASLYLDAFLNAFRVLLVTIPFILLFTFPWMFLLGLDVVVLGGDRKSVV